MTTLADGALKGSTVQLFPFKKKLHHLVVKCLIRKHDDSGAKETTSFIKTYYSFSGASSSLLHGLAGDGEVLVWASGLLVSLLVWPPHPQVEAT